MIVYYYENNNKSIRGTAKIFDIQPKQLRDWKNKKGTLLTTAPHMAKLHQGKPTRYPKLEDDLFAWISEKRANGNAVIQKLIINKAISLSKSPESLANNPDIIGFKFSNRWLDGFLGRYDLSERRRTTVAQQLPSDLIEKQNIFLNYIMYLRIHNKYELKYMGNMDEISM
ncbi:pogo transposable element with KRAB domain [Rhizophagus irregularis DAOM 181602=DAOM 197198]|nr:pogo transposable element with KRAB domain [Rhizophagus irregularis DAOM 181602=DAOM 197198]